jgi:leucyl/phenylalanyl-tRNA---protein transferase
MSLITSQLTRQQKDLVRNIITNYAAGYFLMAEEAGLQWYSSNQRAIIPLDEGFRYPKSLQRVLNSGQFEVELKEIYYLLHTAGWAHSFETWQGDQLAGGILGIVIGGAFIGESMFFNIPEGSKVAMVKLVEHLRQRGFMLFDAQMQNPHLERFGAIELEPDKYDLMLDVAVSKTCEFCNLVY